MRRFYQGPYAEWHWLRIVDGVERCSHAGYASLDACVREARQHGFDADHGMNVARGGVAGLLLYGWLVGTKPPYDR